ncbi:MAG: SDR family oxidoreductase [Chloroflexota bacterium]|nr:SDR family oxidoreductase [Chloroflexota bacterium]
MARPLSEQAVVITGASSGIGRETALRLARRGAKVVVSARSDEALDELVEQIRSEGGEATSIPADVSIYHDVEALASGTVERYGRIDTWVNNAGVLIVGEFENTDLDEARRLFDINFWGELHGCKAVLPIMKAQGGGTIVNVTSVTARRPLPLMSVYSASKAALNGLSEGIRTELDGTGVELCIVMPATIDTPLFEHARSKEGVAPRPVPPIYPPSEVARAIERVAEKPQRQIFAGPAGMGFHVGNFLMPDVLDKALAKVGWTQLTSEPEPPRGNDNLDRGLGGRPSGGWRGRRYKGIELASRIGLALAAFFLVRRLLRR